MRRSLEGYHQTVSGQTIEVAAIGRSTATPPEERVRLQRRARLLAWSGIGWHFIEFAIAVGAGIAAGSIALIGFGADSLIESFAGFTVVFEFDDPGGTIARRHTADLGRTLGRAPAPPTGSTRA